ncbi:MAG TPA: YbgC/FadM family acyl-CoA thioesterase [Rubrivivax sp.]
MRRTTFRFFERLRVRWVEVDMQQIVFNGHYLMFFDAAAAGYWRAMAMPYQDTMARLGGDLYVRKATVEYLGSARYDDVLEIGLRCERIGSSSIVFSAAAFRDESALVTGELVYVFANPATQTSLPVPPPLREVLHAFESGAAMVSTTLGSWVELGPHAQLLRKAVFVDEQKIPAELDADGDDAAAVHALAHNRFGQALATGRLTESSAGVGKIGRMAVLHGVRGAGVGRAVLDALCGAARERGLHELMLHAQRSAVPFYSRAGFTPRGSSFEVAGIEHQAMARAP